MSKQEVFDDVVGILRSVNPKTDHAGARLDNTPLRSYGVDSLTLIRLAVAVEDRYGISLDDRDVVASVSFATPVDVITGQVVAVGCGAS